MHGCLRAGIFATCKHPSIQDKFLQQKSYGYKGSHF